MNRQRGQTLLVALIMLLGLSILTLGNLRSGMLLDNTLAESRDYQAALGGASSAISEAFNRALYSQDMDASDTDTCATTGQDQQEILFCDRLWLEPGNANSAALLTKARTYKGNDLAAPDQLADLSSAPRWYVSAQCESRSSSTMADCMSGNGTLLLQMNALSTGITDQALVRLQEYARVQRR